MIGEIRSLLKQKTRYFRSFWSMINLGIIVCSWTSLGVYIWRYQESVRIGDLFQTTNGYVYINLQLAVYVNDVLTYLFSFCCFFGTIKLVNFLRFNHRLIIFLKTLQYACKQLISFGMMFSILFMAFVILFYLLFVSKLSSAASLLQTSQMLFQMILMNFNAYELIEADAFLGPFCFSLFVFLVVFVCMSMFLTIINHSFRFVRDNAKYDSNENQHTLSFMWNKFQQWIGIERFLINEKNEFFFFCKALEDRMNSKEL
jgi:hypothetical protein